MTPFDVIKQWLSSRSNAGTFNGNDTDFLARKNDKRGEIPPLEGDKAGKLRDPSQMQADKEVTKDPRNIYDDSGSIVDYDMGSSNGSSNPIEKFLKKKMMDIGNRGRRSDAGSDGNPLMNAVNAVNGEGQGNGRGSISGLVARLMGNQPARVGNGADNLSGGTPTTGDLSPTPSKEQPQPGLAPTPAPVYTQPTAIPVEALGDFRNSLLTGAGLDPEQFSKDLGPEQTRGVVKGNLSDSEVTGMSTTDIPAGADPMSFLKGGM